jgi:hypothetical protein
MPTFSKTIKTTEGLKSFAFNRIFTVKEVHFLITVRNRHLLIFFKMKTLDGEWKLVNENKPHPNWVTDVEVDLAAAIDEYDNLPTEL